MSVRAPTLRDPAPRRAAAPRRCRRPRSLHARRRQSVRHALEPPIVVPPSSALDCRGRRPRSWRNDSRIARRAGRAGRQRVGACRSPIALSAGVSTALLGKFVARGGLDPLVAGALGHLGTTASVALMERVRCAASWSAPTSPTPSSCRRSARRGRCRSTSTDVDIGGRYPTEVDRRWAMHAATLEALLPRLAPRDRSPWRREVTDEVDRWRTIAERRGPVLRRAAQPAAPAATSCRPRLPTDAMLAVDVGTVTYWYARHVRARGDIQGHLSSTLASMGSALPYSVAGEVRSVRSDSWSWRCSATAPCR